MEAEFSQLLYSQRLQPWPKQQQQLLLLLGQLLGQEVPTSRRLPVCLG